MTRLGWHWISTVLLATALGVPDALAASTDELPDFKEVHELLRSHLAGVTDADLNRAAVQGLLTSLRGKVVLVGEGTSRPRAGAALMTKCTVLENDVAYIRLESVEAGLEKEISNACEKMSSTNKLKGVVLDLRFTDG